MTNLGLSYYLDKTKYDFALPLYANCTKVLLVFKALIDNIATLSKFRRMSSSRQVSDIHNLNQGPLNYLGLFPSSKRILPNIFYPRLTKAILDRWAMVSILVDELYGAMNRKIQMQIIVINIIVKSLKK
jgi:hypothetical protein